MLDFTDRGNFIPLPLIKNFLKTSMPLLYVIGRNPRALMRNAKAWKKRLNNSRLPWAHLENEENYDSTKILKKNDLEDLSPVSEEKYLRPTRLCECDSTEIRAFAKKLGAYEKDEMEYAKSIFYFVKNEKYLVFKPIVGALGVLKSKGGVCLDQMNLLIALARAGGIKARYRLYALAPTQQLFDLMIKDDPIIRETYELLGFLDSLHGCAELFINGEWIQLDPTFSDALEAGMGLAISEFGEEPEWRIRIPKRDIVFEGFPIFFKNFLIPLAFVLRDTIDKVNKKLDEIREEGRKIIEEVGKEKYRKRKNKIEIPSIEEVRNFRNA